MRQTNEYLNRVVCKFYIKFASQGLTQTYVLAKQVCDENQKKDKKRWVLHAR